MDTDSLQGCPLCGHMLFYHHRRHGCPCGCMAHPLRPHRVSWIRRLLQKH